MLSRLDLNQVCLPIPPTGQAMSCPKPVDNECQVGKPCMAHQGPPIRSGSTPMSKIIGSARERVEILAIHRPSGVSGARDRLRAVCLVRRRRRPCHRERVDLPQQAIRRSSAAASALRLERCATSSGRGDIRATYRHSRVRRMPFCLQNGYGIA